MKFAPLHALLARLLRSGAGGVFKFGNSSSPAVSDVRKILVHKHTFTQPFFNIHGRDRSLQLLSVMTACCGSPSPEPQDPRDPTAVAIVLSNSNQTGRPLRILGQDLRRGILGSFIRSLSPISAPARPTFTHKRAHTHTHTHTHIYMALGKIVRTTSTSLGSPDHLHPEDCGKLRVIRVLF